MKREDQIPGGDLAVVDVVETGRRTWWRGRPVWILRVVHHLNYQRERVFYGDQDGAVAAGKQLLADYLAEQDAKAALVKIRLEEPT